MLKKIKEEEFENEVLKNNKPVIVDFFATWCGPCQMLMPVLKEISTCLNVNSLGISISPTSSWIRRDVYSALGR